MLKLQVGNCLRSQKLRSLSKSSRSCSQEKINGLLVSLKMVGKNGSSLVTNIIRLADFIASLAILDGVTKTETSSGAIANYGKTKKILLRPVKKRHKLSLVRPRKKTKMTRKKLSLSTRSSQKTYSFHRSKSSVTLAIRSLPWSKRSFVRAISSRRWTTGQVWPFSGTASTFSKGS